MRAAPRAPAASGPEAPGLSPTVPPSSWLLGENPFVKIQGLLQPRQVTQGLFESDWNYLSVATLLALHGLCTPSHFLQIFLQPAVCALLGAENTSESDR